MRMRFAKLCSTIGVLFCVFGCTEPTEDFSEFDAKLHALDADLKKLSKEISSVIGEKKCKTDMDCRILELGHVSCGYHTYYEVYSILDTKLDRLQQLTHQFNQKDEELNKLSYKVKNCGTPPPEARCYKKTCIKVAKK